MKEKMTYLRPACEILQAEVTSSFLVTSGGIDPWESGKDNSFDF